MTTLVSLKLGTNGSYVRRLQTLLNSRVIPSPNLPEDGVFGLKTDMAVKRFQTQHALVADGVVGPITWTALGMKQSQTEGPRKPPPPADQPKPTGDWMGIAEGELGVHENSLPGQNNLRILEYHETTTLHATTDEVLLLLFFLLPQADAIRAKTRVRTTPPRMMPRLTPPPSSAGSVISRAGMTAR